MFGAARSQRYAVIPMPLAAAIGVKEGEKASWELLSRKELQVVRTVPANPKTRRAIM